MASACLRDKRLNSREESLSPFTRLTATIDWYTGSFSDRLLGKCTKESAGKRYGTSGATIGNAYLKWAFSVAAVLFLRNNPTGQKYVARSEKKHGKGKALMILAHKLARAVYSMLQRDTAFDLQKFLNG
jgi:transposase